jgi:hypothetical protein
MPTPTDQKPEQNPNEAAEHVASAHKILKELQAKVGSHPELGEAITKLEMALNTLALQTGGLL